MSYYFILLLDKCSSNSKKYCWASQLRIIFNSVDKDCTLLQPDVTLLNKYKTKILKDHETQVHKYET